MNMSGDMETNENAESLARNLWRRFAKTRFCDALPSFSDDSVAIWPNTQERFVGPKNFIAMNEAYPGAWRCEIERIEAFPDGVVTVTRISEGSTVVLAVSFLTISENGITRAEGCFGDVIDPPFDRSRWCERY